MKKFSSKESFVFVPGFPKCGTTWLYKNLKDHSEILIPEKEIDFFSERFSNGYNWYNKMFQNHSKRARIKMDISPSYAYHDCFTIKNPAKEIASYFGKDIKIIFILRDPVERSFSNYINLLQGSLKYGVVYNKKPRILKNNEKEEIYIRWKYHERINLCFEDFINHFSVPNEFTKAVKTHDYQLIQKGFYDIYIENYFKFFNKDNFLFLDYHRIKKEPRLVLKEVFDFLGIKEEFHQRSMKDKANKATDRDTPLNWPLQSRLRRIMDVYSYRHPLGFSSRILKRINSFLGKKPEIKEEDAHFIYKKWFEERIPRIERLTSLDLSHWRR